MGIFNNLFRKKTKGTELTDYQKHWLGLVDMRVKATNFDFIKRTYTVDSFGQEHFNEYKANEHRVPKEEREEVATSRVNGLLSIQDYINKEGSEEQKFHHASSLIGAILYASSLGLHFENQNIFTFDFNEIKAMIDIHVGLEIVFKEIENYIEKFKDNKELTESINTEIEHRFSVIENEINLKKQEKLFKEVIDIISSFPNLLIVYLNDFAYNQFEQGKYKEGLNLCSQSISLFMIGFDEGNEIHRQKLAGYLDTFSYGLNLYGQFKDAVRISDISISLSTDHYYISEHYTNRGKSKLKLNDIEGAKFDFEKALFTNKDFEKAESLLERIEELKQLLKTKKE